VELTSPQRGNEPKRVWDFEACAIPGFYVPLDSHVTLLANDKKLGIAHVTGEACAELKSINLR